MTVKELIEYLKGFDEEAFVVTEIGEPVEVAVLMAGDVVLGRRGFIGEEE